MDAGHVPSVRRESQLTSTCMWGALAITGVALPALLLRGGGCDSLAVAIGISIPALLGHK